MSSGSQNTTKGKQVLKRNAFIGLMCILFILFGLLFALILYCYCNLAKQLSIIKQSLNVQKSNYSLLEQFDLNIASLEKLKQVMNRQSRLLYSLQTVTAKNQNLQQRINALDKVLFPKTKQQQISKIVKQNLPYRRPLEITISQEQPINQQESFFQSIQSAWSNTKNLIVGQIDSFDKKYQVTKHKQFIQYALKKNSQYLQEWFKESIIVCGEKVMGWWGNLL